MKYDLTNFFTKHNVITIYGLFLTSILISVTFISCASTGKKSITEFEPKPVSQIGPVNNPRYFGKQFDKDTPIERVVTEGRSQILESGEQNAYEAALDHALRNAVEIVLGTMIDNRTLVNNGVLLEDKIYSRAYGFVKTYDVLEEYNQGSTKFLKVSADVVIADVRDDAMALGILQDRAERPLLVLAVSEQNQEGRPTTYFKNELEEILVNKELQLIHIPNLTSTTVDALGNDPITIGTQYGGQIMVAGNVEAVENNLSKNPIFKDKNIKSVNVSIALKAFNLGDGRILSSRQVRENGIGLDFNTAMKDGIEKIAQELGGNLVDDFIKKWDLYVNNGFEYSVIFKGIRYNQVKLIKEFTPRRIQGIKAHFDKGFDSTSNTYKTLIRFQGSAEELARRMMIQFKPEINLKIKSYNANTVLLNLE